MIDFCRAEKELEASYDGIAVLDCWLETEHEGDLHFAELHGVWWRADDGSNGGAGAREPRRTSPDTPALAESRLPGEGTDGESASNSDRLAGAGVEGYWLMGGEPVIRRNPDGTVDIWNPSRLLGPKTP